MVLLRLVPQCLAFHEWLLKLKLIRTLTRSSVLRSSPQSYLGHTGAGGYSMEEIHDCIEYNQSSLTNSSRSTYFSFGLPMMSMCDSITTLFASAEMPTKVPKGTTGWTSRHVIPPGLPWGFPQGSLPSFPLPQNHFWGSRIYEMNQRQFTAGTECPRLPLFLVATVMVTKLH